MRSHIAVFGLGVLSGVIGLIIQEEYTAANKVRKLLEEKSDLIGIVEGALKEHRLAPWEQPLCAHEGCQNLAMEGAFLCPYHTLWQEADEVKA